ncbi:MAG: hypothetical protein JNK38_13555 [Acidobacteria bacterium]|nr:hypothetical protein [Acidobacteriota bacterium]
MKRITTLATLVVAFLTLLALPPTSSNSGGEKAIVPVALAQSGDGQDNPFARARAKTCSVGTLKGDYGYLMKGTNLNWLQLPPGPIAIIGVASYDGAGNVFTTATSIMNGFIVPVNQKGTYTVNEDCTGEIIFPLGVYSLAITSDGREIRGNQGYPPGVVIPPGAGWVLEGFAKKIAPEPHNDNPFERAKSFSCTPGVIAGSYATTWNGTMLSSPTFPTGPMTGVSTFNFGQDLAFTSKGKMSFNGMIMPVTHSGTFALQDNCLATVTVNSAGDRVFGVFVDGGNEFFAMELPPAGAPNIPGVGAVVYTISKRTR